MALPRPALIALLGGVLILAAFALTRVTGQAGEADGAAGPVEAPPPAQPVKSGRLSLRIGIEEDGGDKSAKIEFGGPFQGRGAEAVPAFDFELSGTGDGEDFSIGAISTGDRGFISADGKAEELDAETMQLLRDQRQIVARLGAQAGGDDAPPLIDMSGVLLDERAVGVETLDGVETVHSAGRVDVKRLFDEVVGLMKSQAAVEDAALPEEVEVTVTEDPAAIRAIEGALGEVDVDTYVGREDGILRRLTLSADVDVPAEYRDNFEGARALKLDVTLELAEVNEPQTVEPPDEIFPSGEVGLGSLFGYFLANGAVLAIDPPPGSSSIDPASLSAERASGGGEAGSREAGAASRPQVDGVPRGLERAIERGRVAVLVFTQDGGADDAAVRDAVRSLRGVPVFRDDVGDIADYAPVVGQLDIDRAPAVVVVGKDGKAQVVEGYVDAGSLRQLVEDAG